MSNSFIPKLAFLFFFGCLLGYNGYSQTLQNGTIAPNASPQTQILDWLAQNRVRAKSVSNTANLQNWPQGPAIVITGNAVVDQQNYQSTKAAWIQQNQSLYTNARQQQLQFMQGSQNSNVRVDKTGERRTVTSGNGFILPSTSNTSTGNN